MNSGVFQTFKNLCSFLAVWAVVFVCTLSTAHSVGFVPSYLDGTNTHTRVAVADLPELGEEVMLVEGVVGVEDPVAIEVPTRNENPVLPDRIVIDDINLDLPVLNPSSRDIAALEEVLQKGPVRHVDSAKLGEKGNVLIFAHTSHLPVVHNKMYKAFNRVPELEAGDTITVKSEGKSYTYSVISVRRVSAEDAVIDLSKSDEYRLTLVTCDTLTSKSSRFILEAKLVH